MGKYKNVSPVEVHIPPTNHPITVSHIVISGSSSNGSANLKFPLIPKGKFGELITKNNEYDGAEYIEKCYCIYWWTFETPRNQWNTNATNTQLKHTHSNTRVYTYNQVVRKFQFEQLKAYEGIAMHNN